jgi:uncharacterized protein YqgQ
MIVILKKVTHKKVVQKKAFLKVKAILNQRNEIPFRIL